MKILLTYILLFIISFLFYISFIITIFSPVLFAESLIFPYAINPFDIVSLYPKTWDIIRLLFIISSSYTFILIFISVITNFHKKNRFNIKKKSKRSILNPNEINLRLGISNDDEIYISEKGLYQNILITGTIGTGKTSSAMYPFTKQLISYKATSSSQKLGMLILDVKGNYLKTINKFIEESSRENDLIVIDLKNGLKYNPLDKPDLSSTVLANRLKTILTLFSNQNGESYWLDKAEQILSEAIKFCRLYNNNYVTFIELHKLITSNNYYLEKLAIIKENFRNNLYSEDQAYDLLTSIEFFEKELFSLDSRTLSILRSEITRITGVFVSDYTISKTFCPKKHEINFYGFKETLEKGKIIVLNMNIAEYKNLSKIIAAYLKLDFQTEVLSQLSSLNKIRSSAFISDEYQEYITSTDADFFAQSREAKCINIVATQSYSSLLNTLKDESTLKVIIQNLINKLWFRTDDFFTIDSAQKQIGREEKEKFSTTIAENAKETNYNFITNKLKSTNTNISESYNKYTQTDFIYDTNYFSRELKTFEAVGFISDGIQILPPQKINLIPYFKSDINTNINNTETNRNNLLFLQRRFYERKNKIKKY